jgi:hypothetical protein
MVDEGELAVSGTDTTKRLGVIFFTFRRRFGYDRPRCRNVQNWIKEERCEN